MPDMVPFAALSVTPSFQPQYTGWAARFRLRRRAAESLRLRAALGLR